MKTDIREVFDTYNAMVITNIVRSFGYALLLIDQ